MRKVELNMNEQYKYEVIKSVVDGNTSKHTAEFKLGLGRRQINRLINNYKESGKEAFKHKNRGRKSAQATPEKLKQKVCELYLSDPYCDANFQHFCELLEEHHNIKLSYTTITTLLRDDDIISPKAHKKTKRALKNELRRKQAEVKTKNEKLKIEDKIIALEQAHPNKSRKKYFGELAQLDASKAVWFGSEYSHLHVAIDDCTGTIIAAYFDKEETLHAYYTLYRQILMTYGIPHEFLTDYRTVFSYQSKSKVIDSHTQFSYACKQLGTLLSCTFVPQAKGRVERVFGTLQSRLITELKIHKISKIDEANEFLNSYIKKFNQQFAYDIDYNTSVFELAPSDDEINIRLGVLDKRIIGNGHHFKYQHHYYVPVDRNGNAVLYPSRTPVVLIKAFDGTLYVSVNDTIYLAKQMNTYELHSENFDTQIEVDKPQTIKYVPPMTHPWKMKNYVQFFEREKLSHQEWEDLYYSQANLLANPHQISGHF